MNTIRLTEGDNGQRIRIAEGDELEIALSEKPTTGYRWQLTDANAADWQLLSEDFERVPPGAIGGGGTKTIRLKALRKGTGTVVLENRQPWSGDADRRFEIAYE